MLDAGNSFVKIGLTVLIEKSLIESCENNELWMHDLLRQVGQTIVRDEHREPGKRSRLWDVKDVCHVLERNTGTAAVEGISFNMSKISKDIKVCHAAFSEMYNLRILKIYCDKKFKLSWLYPLKSLPSMFSPENLVELILRGSHIQKLWNHHEVKSVPTLRRIDLSYSKFLTQISNLSLAPSLSINLEGCKSLVQVLSSLQNLEKLTYLNLNGCSKHRDLDDKSKRAEGYLDVARLGGIKNLWKNFTYLKSCIQNFTGNLCLYSSQGHISQKFAPNLRCLLLRQTAIETLPPSIGDLSGLVQLDLFSCRNFKSLPSSICHLKSLESLNLCACEKLKKFPKILKPMKRLSYLKLSYSGIKDLSESVVNLVSLRYLETCGCKDLEFLPNYLCTLRNLKRITLSYCSKNKKLPSLPQSLHELCVDNCERLKYLPELPSLCKNLSASGCTSLENISTWSAAPLLDHLSDIYVYTDSIDFYGCEKWDQNTHNTMIADRAVIQILARIKVAWTIDDGSLYKYHNCTKYDMFNKSSSDHVLIWYVKRQSSKYCQGLDGLDWPTTCSTEASFHVCLDYYDWVSKLSNVGSEYGEIKKFGVRFVYKQDMERCDAETE
ncbi:disease resistance protein RPP2B-like [Ziziphus jujuba]|uniref:Disease resistance protein RPP2B-like n=1 Tax=Ziziphus jujuba TaxID=326968 RepID=A0ABM4AB20_ZIZJJ|nr:disease resistance protein RPP2B-like [Ziziphus jujuba]